MSANGTSPPPNRTRTLRTERKASCGEDAHIARTDDPSDYEVSLTILRTEQSSPDRPPLGPLGEARVLTANLLHASLTKRWENGEAWASNRCVAERYCSVTESVVRRWRDGQKLIPLAALHVLPAALAQELAQGVLGKRAVSVPRTMGALRDAVTRLEGPIAEDDREDALRGLIDAQRRISERIARLATGAK